MGVRYPGPVSRHNLVCSLLLYPDCPCLGPFGHDGGRFATTMAVGALGRHGAVGKRSNFRKILRTRRIMVMHSNERGECCLHTLVDHKRKSLSMRLM